MAKYNIKVNFEEKDHEPMEIQSEEGYSLLEALLENDVHLNHNCGGVCACSTCHVYVEKGSDLVEEISDKEEDFVDRAINPRIESRLACQCTLLDITEDKTIEVTVPDQSNIIGHEH